MDGLNGSLRAENRSPIGQESKFNVLKWARHSGHSAPTDLAYSRFRTTSNKYLQIDEGIRPRLAHIPLKDRNLSRRRISLGLPGNHCD
jgi:hypothetical protein